MPLKLRKSYKFPISCLKLYLENILRRFAVSGRRVESKIVLIGEQRMKAKEAANFKLNNRLHKLEKLFKKFFKDDMEQYDRVSENESKVPEKAVPRSLPENYELFNKVFTILH